MSKNFTFKKINEELQRKRKIVLEREMSDLHSQIQIDTSAGRDIYGKRMKAYSKGYKKYKQSKGRNSNVNLNFSGKLMQSLTYKVREVRTGLIGMIFFRSMSYDTGASTIGVARHNVKTRKFFGLAPEKLKKILAQLSRIQ